MPPKKFRYLRWLNVILILVTFLAYLSPYVHPSTFWPPSFFGLIFPWLLLANFLFVLTWVSLRQRYFLFSLGCILMGWGNVKSIVGIHSSNPVIESSIRVMTFNTRSIRDKDNSNQKLSIEELKQFTQLEKVDILSLQEFPSGQGNKPHMNAIAEQSGLKYYYNDMGYGLLIYSKYPVLNKGGKYFNNRANGFQFIDIEKEGQKFRIYNIHLQSNLVSGTADKVAQNGTLQEKETWLDIRRMMGKYRYFSKRRAEQAKEIVEHMAQSPHPIILCGDFNDVPQSHAYHLLSGALQDGFKKKGQGLGFTFTGDLPGLRIDYIMAQKAFKFLGYQKKEVSYSDHQAIIASLKLRN